MASKNDFTNDFFEIPEEPSGNSETSRSRYGSFEQDYNKDDNSTLSRSISNKSNPETEPDPKVIKSRSAVRQSWSEAEPDIDVTQLHQAVRSSRSDITSLGLVKARGVQTESITIPLTKPKKRHQPTGSRLTPDFDNSSLTERFHVMFQQLGFIPSLEQPLVIGVTSSVRGEGRTTVALGLATAISMQIPLPVLLVEADVVQPILATDLGSNNQGLCEYLRDELTLEEAIHQEALNELAVMFAGDLNGQALKTLRSNRLEELFAELIEQYAVIVVDLPPLAMTAESSRLISQLDHVLMVVQAGSTPSRLVKAALDLVPEDKRAGVVLNQTRPSFGPFHWLGKLFHKVV